MHDMLTGIYIANSGLKPVIETLEDAVKAVHESGFVTYGLESPNHDDMLHDPPDETLIVTVHLPPYCFLGNVTEKLQKQMHEVSRGTEFRDHQHAHGALHRMKMYQAPVW